MNEENNVSPATLATLIEQLDDDGDGYNVPFGTFTWASWQEMQAQTMQRFTRFQRAIDHNKPATALKIATEMQEMTILWFKEAISLLESL